VGSVHFILLLTKSRRVVAWVHKSKKAITVCAYVCVMYIERHVLFIMFSPFFGGAMSKLMLNIVCVESLA
jgi:hypothetical protein